MFGSKRTRNRGALVLVSTLLGLALVSVQPSVAQTPADEEQAARDALTPRRGPRPQLVFLSRTTATYPLQGKTVIAYKVMDRSTGEIHDVYLHRLRPVDPLALEAEERRIYGQRYGRFDPGLFEQLTRLGDEEEVPVLIWLKEPEYDRPQRPPPDGGLTLERIQAAAAAADQHRAAFVATLTTPLVGRLREIGAAADPQPYVPVLSSTLRVRELRVIGQWPEVDLISQPLPPKNALLHARPTIKADIVQAAGFTGIDVRTAQVEPGGRIVSSHPSLPAIARDTVDACASASDHGTQVAGIIVSQNATNKGVAPKATHRAGGACETNSQGGALPAATVTANLLKSVSRAVEWQANAINLSYGAYGVGVVGDQDKFFDSLVINNWKMVVAAAGNNGGPNCAGTPGTSWVSSPGTAYNVMTVGAFNDKNSASWTLPTKDSMWFCSGWKNPSGTYPDREKPDVVAPGVSLTSTGLVGMDDMLDGTSFAAPMVTGGAALLMDRNPDLIGWPESLRAILQATSYNNIEGNATSRAGYLPQAGFAHPDYKDGAGGIDLQRASITAARIGNSGWGGQEIDCGTAYPLNASKAFLTKGVKARVAIAWDNDPAYNMYSSRPSADFELFVLRPNGTTVASAISRANTSELVEFVPDIDGLHTIQVRKVRCDYSPFAIGWAWHNLQ
jgi:hypothetical protein